MVLIDVMIVAIKTRGARSGTAHLKLSHKIVDDLLKILLCQNQHIPRVII